MNVPRDRSVRRWSRVLVILVTFVAGIGVGLNLQILSKERGETDVGIGRPFVSPGISLPSATRYWLTPPDQRPALLDKKPILRVPGDYATIQQAIDEAPEGGHVLVAPGTYREALRLSCKPLTVSSEEGPVHTIVDAGGMGSVAHFEALPEDRDRCTLQRWRVVLSGFTLRGGIGTADFHEGSENLQGGGIYVKGLSPVITWNVVEENEGENGGGLLCSEACGALVANNWFRHNRAIKGAGIRISNSSPVVVNNLVQANEASLFGGGIYWRQRSMPIIANNTVVDNRAGHRGGGFFGSNAPAGSHYVTLANNVIVGNDAPQGDGLAVNLTPTAVRLTSNLLPGGPAAIAELEPDVVVLWEVSNLAHQLSTRDVLPPRTAFAGAGRGAASWMVGFDYDFLGRPRVRARGDLREVDIGAIQAAESPLAGGFWPPFDAPAEP